MNWDWLAWLPNELRVLILAALPFVELRGAIPVAVLMGIPAGYALFLGILGNVLPIFPLLYFFEPLTQKIYQWSPRYRKFFEKVQQRAVSNGESIRKYGAVIGLILFVAIPFPGTGAYTACFAAAFFRIPFWTSFFSIFIGTILSGILIVTLSNSLAFLIGWN